MGGGGQSYALLNPELCVEQQSLTASTDLKSPISLGEGDFLFLPMKMPPIPSAVLLVETEAILALLHLTEPPASGLHCLFAVSERLQCTRLVAIS